MKYLVLSLLCCVGLSLRAAQAQIKNTSSQYLACCYTKDETTKQPIAVLVTEDDLKSSHNFCVTEKETGMTIPVIADDIFFIIAGHIYSHSGKLEKKNKTKK